MLHLRLILPRPLPPTRIRSAPEILVLEEGCVQPPADVYSARSLLPRPAATVKRQR